MAEYLGNYGGVIGAAVALTGAAATAAMYMLKAPAPFVPPVDLDAQSILLPGPERARTSKMVLAEEFTSKYPVKTLYDIMYCGKKNSNDGNCLGRMEGTKGQRYFKWLKYSQVIEEAKKFGSGLMELGIKPDPSNFIGIYSKNSVEWIIVEQACYHFSLVLVPLYDTLGPTVCSYIIQQGEITLLVCQDDAKAVSILNEASETPTLKHIVSFEKVSPATEKLAEERGIKIHLFKDVVEQGKSKPHEPVPPKPEDVATICYTSGTTGNPKGAMLTHGALTASASVLVLSALSSKMGPHDVALSFLPLAHVMERVIQISFYMVGGQMGFYGGNIQELMEALQVLKPTFVALVPRLMNRLYNKAYAAVNGSVVKEKLMDSALRSKTAELKRQVIRNDGFWDWLVFKKVREALGGRVKLMVVGSAPTSDKVLTFTRAAMGCIVIEAYGQTECVAACTASIVGDSSTEHVGAPLPTYTVKLVDVPEMNYFAENDQGEVCLKGPAMFKGYYKEPEKTAEILDSDGWLHTGDIGMWLPNGALKIIDRKKHIFKLSQGEYIAPEKIENCYLKCNLIVQIFVHGESLKSSLVAVVVPEIKPVLKLCKDNGLIITLDDIYKNEKVKKLILSKLQAQGKEDGLKSFEQIRDIFLFNGTFSLENGLVTPTMKAKRPALKDYFKPQIDAMYSSIE